MSLKSINDVRTPVVRPEKVLQFGEGNFLRAFTDWMIDIANEKTDFNGNVILVQPRGGGRGDIINRQKGLYTTVLRGIQNGSLVTEKRTVTSVSRCINPYTAYTEYMRCAEIPGLRFVVSNTTEAGIAWADGCKKDDEPPASFPAKVAQFLYRRFTFFKGDSTKGLIFIPCELIDKNGAKLKEYILRHAAEWQLEPAFSEWVNSACFFCNSLVDRIVPGFPAEEAEALCAESGYNDELIDAAELFHLWVIESGKDFSKEFPLAQADLNVIWTDDMSFYRTRKVRILNGAHTLFVPAAYRCGFATVDEALRDTDIRAFIRKGLFEEIIPSMDGERQMLESFAEDVLERFENPYIHHRLISITLNSVSKFKTRDLPSLTAYIEKFGTVPQALSFGLAALISFYRNADDAQDDPAVLAHFKELYKVYPAADAAAARAVSYDILQQTAWWGEDLAKRGALADAVAAHLESIWTHGMKSAVAKIAHTGAD